jgi:hypothetical protein
MDQSELMRHVIHALEASGIGYMITGSQASAYYGEPRFTRDIDIVAELHEDQIGQFVGFFPPEDYYCDEEMIRKAIRQKSQFKSIHSKSGLKIDVILKKAAAFSREEFSRRKRGAVLEGLEAYFAAPEDVIIKKMQYYREGGSEKQLRDITGILKVTGDDIDLKYISLWAERLGVRKIWEAIVKRLQEP